MSEQKTPPNNGRPGKLGVPRNPERDGYHYFLRGDFYSIALWHRGHFNFLDAAMWPEEFLQDVTYLGPVLTPEEIAAKDARIAELRQIIRYVAGCEHATASDEDLLEQVAAAICRMNNIDPTGHISINGGAYDWAWRHFLPQARAALGVSADG